MYFLGHNPGGRGNSISGKSEKCLPFRSLFSAEVPEQASQKPVIFQNRSNLS